MGRGRSNRDAMELFGTLLGLLGIGAILTFMGIKKDKSGTLQGCLVRGLLIFGWLVFCSYLIHEGAFIGFVLLSASLALGGACIAKLEYDKHLKIRADREKVRQTHSAIESEPEPDVEELEAYKLYVYSQKLIWVSDAPAAYRLKQWRRICGADNYTAVLDSMKEHKYCPHQLDMWAQ